MIYSPPFSVGLLDFKERSDPALTDRERQRIKGQIQKWIVAPYILVPASWSPSVPPESLSVLPWIYPPAGARVLARRCQKTKLKRRIEQKTNELEFEKDE